VVPPIAKARVRFSVCHFPGNPKQRISGSSLADQPMADSAVAWLPAW